MSSISELEDLVKNMKIKDNKKNIFFNKIKNCNSLTEKCIIGREYLSPQSTYFETMIMNDLLINKPNNETSGDGCKNNINYEIKVSLHGKQSNFNFVQIRPDHKIDFYIFIGYNMYNNNTLGKGYIFKIPSDSLYELIIDYGGYAHGTFKKLGKISHDNLKGRNCEYVLRCDPNKKKGKNYDLWNKLLKYEVEYKHSNF